MPILMTNDDADGHIRIGKNTHKWLDDYSFVCSFKIIGDHIKLFAACGTLGMQEYQELRFFLKEKGFISAEYQRVHNGALVTRKIIL